MNGLPDPIILISHLLQKNNSQRTIQSKMVADIAIVGGGPAGLALAGTLERAGISFVVYERSALDTPPRGGCLYVKYFSKQC